MIYLLIIPNRINRQAIETKKSSIKWLVIKQEYENQLLFCKTVLHNYKISHSDYQQSI